uniref:Integrase catalytic domain-containing protein n=1 Tax=Steinernema glaseri TaxID=37863 RepID=A0A1I8AVT6_9BILA
MNEMSHALINDLNLYLETFNQDTAHSENSIIEDTTKASSRSPNVIVVAAYYHNQAVGKAKSTDSIQRNTCALFLCLWRLLPLLPCLFSQESTYRDTDMTAHLAINEEGHWQGTTHMVPAFTLARRPETVGLAENLNRLINVEHVYSMTKFHKVQTARHAIVNGAS